VLAATERTPAYYAASNRTGYTDPVGGTVTYGYDTLNRLTSLNSSVAGRSPSGTTS